MWIHCLIYTHRHIQADLLHYICTFLFIGRIIGIFRSAKYIRYSREGFWDPVIKIFLVLVVIFKKKGVACHKSIISYNPLELSVQIYIGWTFSTLIALVSTEPQLQFLPLYRGLVGHLDNLIPLVSGLLHGEKTKKVFQFCSSRNIQAGSWCWQELVGSGRSWQGLAGKKVDGLLDRLSCEMTSQFQVDPL